MESCHVSGRHGFVGPELDALFHLKQRSSTVSKKAPTVSKTLHLQARELPTQLGRTAKGAYSTRGRSRHLLGTPFWKTPSENPSQNPFLL